jgi:hypothetical protein
MTAQMISFLGSPAHSQMTCNKHFLASTGRVDSFIFMGGTLRIASRWIRQTLTTHTRNAGRRSRREATYQGTLETRSSVRECRNAMRPHGFHPSACVQLTDIVWDCPDTNMMRHVELGIETHFSPGDRALVGKHPITDYASLSPST